MIITIEIIESHYYFNLVMTACHVTPHKQATAQRQGYSSTQALPNFRTTTPFSSKFCHWYVAGAKVSNKEETRSGLTGPSWVADVKKSSLCNAATRAASMGGNSLVVKASSKVCTCNALWTCDAKSLNKYPCVSYNKKQPKMQKQKQQLLLQPFKTQWLLPMT